MVLTDEHMAPLGLYSALATTAGVFVGFLNAYLVSRISNMKSDRRRTIQRVESINAQLDSLYEYWEWRDGQISEQKDEFAKKRARAEVEMFVGSYVGEEWTPDGDIVTVSDYLDALADYLGRETDALNEFHKEAIRENRERLSKNANSRLPEWFREMVKGGILGKAPPSFVLLSREQADLQWRVFEQEIWDKRNDDLATVEREIHSLTDERERLKAQYKEADPTELIQSVRLTGGTIILSVGVPLFTYLLHAIGITITVPFGQLVEASLVFTLWCSGLVITYHIMRRGVTSEEDDFPPAPEDESEKRILRK